MSDFRKLEYFIRRVRKERAPTDVNHRFLRTHNLFRRLLDLVLVAGDCGIITAQADLVRIFEFSLIRAHVFGNVDQNRAGPAGCCNVESLFDRTREVIHVLHENVVLCAWTADADVIGFLKGVVADQVGGHLTREGYQRNRIHVSVGQTGNDIGHSRARRN